MKATTKMRKELFAQDCHCFWCGRETHEGSWNEYRTSDDRIPSKYTLATLDHLWGKYDLRRTPENQCPVVLACYACNQLRGYRDSLTWSLSQNLRTKEQTISLWEYFKQKFFPESNFELLIY